MPGKETAADLGTKILDGPAILKILAKMRIMDGATNKFVGSSISKIEAANTAWAELGGGVAKSALRSLIAACLAEQPL